jgi:hypothetical protein
MHCITFAKFTNPKIPQEKLIINKPSNSYVDKKFRDYGLYFFLKLENTQPDGSLILPKRAMRVSESTAVEARRLASSKTLGDMNKKIRPLYRTLIELMSNTKKHAKGKHHASETWWLLAYYNPNSRITNFTFIDTGVGILQSSRVKKTCTSCIETKITICRKCIKANS